MSWFYGALDAHEQQGILSASRPASVAPRSTIPDDADLVSTHAEFLAWIEKHKISFRDSGEREARFELFAQERLSIAARNGELSSEKGGFRVGLNVMAALTREERDSLTGGLHVLPQGSGDQGMPSDGENGRNKGKQVSSLRGGYRPLNGRHLRFDRHGRSLVDGIGPLGQDMLPLAIDWRKLGAVTDVKSQGACGACWAFAATGAIEALMHKTTGSLVSLSENQLLECDPDEFQQACNGGNFFFSFIYASKNAVAISKDYPFAYQSSGATQDCRMAGTGGYIEGAVIGDASIETNTGRIGVERVGKTEQELKKIVSTIGPVAVAISGYSEDFQRYTEGVFSPDFCDDKVDHAVLIVGYGTTQEGLDFWLIKNQWGIGWGENGYMKLARGTKTKTENGPCGILTQANYPSAATCAPNTNCTELESSQFCRTTSQASVECLDAGDIEYDEWFIPNSTFDDLTTKEELDYISPAGKDGLFVAAILIVVAMAFLGVFMGRARIRQIKHHDEQVSCASLFCSGPADEKARAQRAQALAAKNAAALGVAGTHGSRVMQPAVQLPRDLSEQEQVAAWYGVSTEKIKLAARYAPSERAMPGASLGAGIKQSAHLSLSSAAVGMRTGMHSAKTQVGKGASALKSTVMIKVAAAAHLLGISSREDKDKDGDDTIAPEDPNKGNNGQFDDFPHSFAYQQDEIGSSDEDQDDEDQEEDENEEDAGDEKYANDAQGQGDAESEEEEDEEIAAAMKTRDVALRRQTLEQVAERAEAFSRQAEETLREIEEETRAAKEEVLRAQEDARQAEAEARRAKRRAESLTFEQNAKSEKQEQQLELERERQEARRMKRVESRQRLSKTPSCNSLNVLLEKEGFAPRELTQEEQDERLRRAVQAKRRTLQGKGKGKTSRFSRRRGNETDI